MVYPWTVTDNVNFIIGYLMGQWKIAIEAFFVICTFINNGKGAVSAGYFIGKKSRRMKPCRRPCIASVKPRSDSEGKESKKGK